MGEMVASETRLRRVFEKYAVEGLVELEAVPKMLETLAFPDLYGDGFTRFVREWNDEDPSRCGSSDSVDIHAFMACVNLLVTFVDQQRAREDPKTPCMLRPGALVR